MNTLPTSYEAYCEMLEEERASHSGGADYLREAFGSSAIDDGDDSEEFSGNVIFDSPMFVELRAFTAMLEACEEHTLDSEMPF